jgi:hypothetical protein
VPSAKVMTGEPGRTRTYNPLITSGFLRLRIKPSILRTPAANLLEMKDLYSVAIFTNWQGVPVAASVKVNTKRNQV